LEKDIYINVVTKNKFKAAAEPLMCGGRQEKMKKVSIKRILIGLAAVPILSVMSALTAYGQENSAGKTEPIKVAMPTFAQKSSVSKTEESSVSKAAGPAFPIKVTYETDDGKAVSDKTIYLVYFDEVKKSLVELTANTGSDGSAVTFQVPFDGDNRVTYVLILTDSKEFLDTVKAAIGKGRVRMAGIEPGEDCEELDLTMYASGKTKFNNCEVSLSVQFK